MNIMTKALLLVYLLLIVLVIIVGVVWILTEVFMPKWATKKVLLMKHHEVSESPMHGEL